MFIRSVNRPRESASFTHAGQQTRARAMLNFQTNIRKHERTKKKAAPGASISR